MSTPTYAHLYADMQRRMAWLERKRAQNKPALRRGSPRARRLHFRLERQATRLYRMIRFLDSLF